MPGAENPQRPASCPGLDGGFRVRVRGECIRCRRTGGSGGDEPVFLADACASCLDLAWQLAAEGRFPVWASALALTQHAGRGRMGRTWRSPPGNLHAAWRLPDLDSPWQDLASLLVGDAVRHALDAMGVPVCLKWPNDLMIENRKLGGILIEEREGRVMAGIGINLVAVQPASDPDETDDLPAACLADAGMKADPPAFYASLRPVAMARIRETLSCGRPDMLLDRVWNHLAFKGRQVRVQTGAEIFSAVMTGLSPCGGLILTTPNGSRVIRSGSLRPDGPA